MQNNEQELVQYAKELGKKLGFLITSLNVSDETREAFFDILDDFTLEQMERLTEVLEVKFLAEQTDFIEADLIKELVKIKEETLQKLADLDQETLKRLSI